MNVFCDTTVLVAGSVRQHPHFVRAHEILREVAQGRLEGHASCHSLAEAYSALTNMPVSPRILPVDAERMIAANIRACFRLAPVKPSYYDRAVTLCARLGLPGGCVYDALLIECARAVNCDRLYTFNLVHFRRLAPDLADKLTAP